MENPFIKVAQITDSHIMPHPQDELHGIKPLDHLNQILKYIAQKDYDFILFTGDLSHQGDLASYQLIDEALSIIKQPIYYIPGNHDLPENLEAILAERYLPLSHHLVTYHHWQFIAVPTVVPNRNDGLVNSENLQRLRQQLQESSVDQIVLVMHHHPISISPSTDKYKLKNHTELHELLNHKVKLIIFGHVHNDYSFLENQIAYHACPSTGFQFTGHETLSVDPKIGYKEYLFYPNHFSVNCIWR